MLRSQYSKPSLGLRLCLVSCLVEVPGVMLGCGAQVRGGRGRALPLLCIHPPHGIHCLGGSGRVGTPALRQHGAPTGRRRHPAGMSPCVTHIGVLGLDVELGLLLKLDSVAHSNQSTLSVVMAQCTFWIPGSV
jgi:hypothetical protein